MQIALCLNGIMDPSARWAASVLAGGFYKFPTDKFIILPYNAMALRKLFIL
jgi:hypothetical protein